MQDVDVVILSINSTSYSKVASLFAGVLEDTIAIDTSNYHPVRDNRIEAIDAGQVESLWVVEQLGRPIVKAWNTVVSGSFSNKGKPAGSLGRIALPVAADRDRDREVGWRWWQIQVLMPSMLAHSKTSGGCNRERLSTALTLP
ncbi:hypothetical protein NC992_22920 [Leptolyngbya subtilissima DQ-A4]|uniref:Uncharacterized protein n=1 Tax=Leptolyngbya subtilissima DQ-A4 TaxID=2933933 RepID=A0ABV0KB14_9CYAN